MSRRPIVSGNWKMHHTHLEAIAVVQKLAYVLEAADTDAVEVVLHPAFTALRSVQTLIDADRLPLGLGAQDVHWEDRGAHTGEISPTMLAKLQVSYVIVGHSERRREFGETDEVVNRKVRAVLAAGMAPIVCVGEDAGERDAGITDDLVSGQVRLALAGVDPEAVARCVVAYEPLWAIGTGRSATPEDAQAVAAAVRATVATEHGPAAADGLRVQYGGSVTPDNVVDLVAGGDVDGALVGGASLDPDTFGRLVAAVAGA